LFGHAIPSGKHGSFSNLKNPSHSICFEPVASPGLQNYALQC